MHWGWGEYGMGAGFGIIFMIVFWALVIVGIFFIIKMITGGGVTSEKEYDQSAEEILKRRFAKGELSREEFEEAIKVLKQFT